MENKTHSIDDLFHEKLNGVDNAEVISHSWSEVDDLLNRHEKTQRFKKIAVISSVLLIATLITGYFAMQYNQNTIQKKDQIVNNNTEISSRKLELNASEESAITDISKPKLQDKVNYDTSTNKKKNFLESENKNNTKISRTKIIDESTELDNLPVNAKEMLGIQKESQKELLKDYSGINPKFSFNSSWLSFISGFSDHSQLNSKWENNWKTSAFDSIITIDNNQLVINQSNLTPDLDKVSVPLTDRLNGLRRMRLNVKLGFDTWGGFGNQNATALSVGPRIGLDLGYRMNEYFTLFSGFEWFSRGGMKYVSQEHHPEIAGRIIEQNMGKMTGVSIPFLFQYHYGDHLMQFGMSWHGIQKITGTEKVIDASDPALIYSDQSHLFTENYASFDVSANFGYEYRIMQAAGIGIRLNYGLYDMIDDEWSGVSTQDKLVGLNFYVNYKLIKY